MRWIPCCLFFFFNDTATTEIYTLSLHDALPICAPGQERVSSRGALGLLLRLRDGGGRREHLAHHHYARHGYPVRLDADGDPRELAENTGAPRGARRPGADGRLPARLRCRGAAASHHRLDQPPAKADLAVRLP